MPVASTLQRRVSSCGVAKLILNGEEVVMPYNLHMECVSSELDIQVPLKGAEKQISQKFQKWGN